MSSEALPDGQPIAARAGRSPVVGIVAATAVSGAAGYAITWIVAATSSPADYAGFAVFWSTLFLVVGALGGVQQELTRATGPRASADAVPAAASSAAPLPRFVIGAAVLAAAVLAATSWWWGAAVLDGRAPAVWAIVAGAACYVLVAGFVGVLYGARLWRPIAAMIAFDGVARLVLVLLVVATGGDPVALQVAAVLPFPLAVAIGVPLVIRRLRGIGADVGTAALVRNAAVAVAAAAATAVLVSGLPALLGAAAGGTAPAALAPVLLALMLTRAPIVVPAIALQSYLIMRFRGATSLRPALAAGGVTVAVGAVLAVLGALIGPPLLALVFGEAYRIDPLLAGALVLSSGLVAAVVVIGAGLLADARHGAYLAGWATAAVATIAALAPPWPLDTRILLALLAAPVAGLLVQVVALALGRRSR